MKKIVLFSLCSVVMFSNCSKSEDLYEGPQGSQVSDEQIAQNVKDVFGTEFDMNQGWDMITRGQVSIIPDAPGFTPVKVQVLTGFPSKYNTAEVLIEADVRGNNKVAVEFDAPVGQDTLYAACVNAKGQYRAKAFAMGEKEVSFAVAAGSRQTRAFRAGENTVPEIIGEGELSDNAKQVANGHPKWEGSSWCDKLYDTKLKKQEISNFTSDERTTMNAIIQANVPEYSDNRNRIQASDVYINTSNYFTTTGQQEIQITPVACGAWFCGWEQLYYYYFNPSDLAGMNDDQRREYLQALPKFKIAEVAETFGNVKYNTVEEKVKDSRDYYQYMLNRTDKHYTYTLAYFGDNGSLTEQSYAFPAGYQIGIMLRVDSINKDTHPAVYSNLNRNLMAGEIAGGANLYADRLLNDEVNFYSGFLDGHLGKNMSRAAIFGANGKNYVGFEDLKDNDFNDVVFEVTGGVEIIDESMLLDHKVYTLAFEDTKLGDYDLNDVVIKAQRIDLTHVKFSLEACGAQDELYLRNINGQKLNTTTEVHAIFGQTGSRNFVNTVSGQPHIEAVQEVIEVPVSFSFSEDRYLPWIYNASRGYEVQLSRKGEDPHGIIIPDDFQYPVERMCVGGDAEKAAQGKVAYTRFNSWGKNRVDANDWYKTPTDNKVYVESVMK